MEDRNIAWTEEDSKTFIKYGKCFTPDRERQIELICDLIPNCDVPFHVVDLCCGEGRLAEGVLDRFPQAHVHLYDASQAMLNQARENLSRYGDRTSYHTFDIHAGDWRQFDFPVHAFVSSLAIHHLDGAEKQTFFTDLYNALSEGGVFLNADLIYPASQLGMQVAAKCWDKETQKRSIDIYQTLDGFKAFEQLEWNYFKNPDNDPIDKPSPIADQLSWLGQSGYIGVDVFWLVAGHAIYGGYKACQATR